jgi:hypothetical protein
MSINVVPKGSHTLIACKRSFDIEHVRYVALSCLVASEEVDGLLDLLALLSNFPRAQSAVRSRANTLLFQSACPGFGMCADVLDVDEYDAWPITAMTVSPVHPETEREANAACLMSAICNFFFELKLHPRCKVAGSRDRRDHMIRALIMCTVRDHMITTTTASTLFCMLTVTDN